MDQSNSSSNEDEPTQEGSGMENTDQQQDPSKLVLDLIMNFTQRSETEVQNHLSTLGVTTISDLGVIDLNTFISNKDKDKDGAADVDLIDFNHVFSSVQKKLLLGKRRLSKPDRLSISKAVGDEMHSNLRSVSRTTCSKVARCLVTQYKDALSSSLPHSETGLASQIFERVKYKRRLDQRNNVSHQSTTPGLRQFSKAQNAGIDAERDLSSTFPDGETRETQEAKRVKIINEGLSGEMPAKTINKLMRETYVLQRFAVHNKKHLAEILEDWPFFGRFGILKNHFYDLMDLDGEAVGVKMTEVCPAFIKFFEAEGNKKRKGEGAKMCSKIREIIAAYSSKREKSPELELTAVILCVAAKLNQDLSHLYLHFEETTSYDEVQASPKLPKDGRPIIAVLGENLLDLPECFVLADNTMLSSNKLTPLKAILAAFMCYFVLKITFPQKMAALLDFMQRYNMIGTHS